MIIRKDIWRKLIVFLIVIVIVISIFIPLSLNFKWYPFHETFYPEPPLGYKLDYNYIRNATENFSKIVLNNSKGRAFGTKGEWDAAKIIKEDMTNFGLNTTLERIENIHYPEQLTQGNINLTTKLEVISQNLTIIKNNNEKIPVTEFYISPRWNDSFYFFNKSYDENLLSTAFQERNLTVLYDTPNETWIDDFLSDDRVYDILNNNSTYNLSSLLDLLFTFFNDSYNFSYKGINIDDKTTWPPFFSPINASSNFTLIQEDPSFNPKKPKPPWHEKYETNPIISYLIPPLKSIIRMRNLYLLEPHCKGVIKYDFHDETYNMNLHNYIALPFIYINGSLGKRINESRQNYTISYDLTQRYNESVISYNVIGELKEDNSEETIILCSLYDSWWCQGTADSAIGMSIVLGIAKCFHDFNITPLRNVKFIAFGGEEYGLRGARYYEANHSGENIMTMVDLNQLGFDQPDAYRDRNLTLEIWTNRWYLLKTLREKTEKTKYTERTDNEYQVGYKVFVSHGGNYHPFSINRSLLNLKFYPYNTETIYLVKNHDWVFHHRDGQDHTEGDSMLYYNSTDVNVTAQLVFNITYALIFREEPTIYVFIPFVIIIVIIVVAFFIIFRKELFKKF